ncbi:MAG: type 4a pilus biogenesis protein PilO [Candidatus Hydrogenedentes bacterium]|nr:type 4a pilus biogenesis protein PilO [Candidatus Hydrogenedentota bacterium]
MMDFWKGTVTPRDWAAVGIILGATVLVAVGFYFVLYSGQNEKLAGLVAENQQVAQKLKQALETQENIGDLRAEASQMQELVTQFEERLPNTQEIQTLLRQFESLAGETGLLVELSKLAPEGDTKKEVIPYSVKARGTFHQIASFINRLERYQRYLKISELNIGKVENGIATASFRLSTFRFKQPSEESKS